MSILFDPTILLLGIFLRHDGYEDLFPRKFIPVLLRIGPRMERGVKPPYDKEEVIFLFWFLFAPHDVIS